MAETVRAALARAAAALADWSVSARLDAELLMASALGVGRDALLLGRLDDPSPVAFEALLDRRRRHEPVAYIVGERDFWTITLAVGPGVLVPRPDSETLIEAAVEHFGGCGPATILDLGTGSGALLLAALAEWPDARGVGVDRSDDALAIATRNAERLGLAVRAELRAGDWGQGIEGPFDLILCNPPYIEMDADLAAEVRGYEPAGALFAGIDGLDDYRRLGPDIARLLAPAGLAVVEIGWTQAEAVSALLADAGLTTMVRQDLGGRDRAIVARH
jgi:release factor glutamine methyltransferase